MINASIVILLESEWLIAGGESELGTADLAPIKDGDGLPVIPGRTLRGLLREATTLIDDAHRSSHATRLFGTRKQPGASADAGDGALRIGNAVVAAELANLCDSTDSRQDFYTSVRRTALEPGTRTAKAHSLREFEVAIAGLELVAPLACPDEESLGIVAFAAGLVRSLGHSRSRGLGRCRMEVWRDGACIAPALAARGKP